MKFVKASHTADMRSSTSINQSQIYFLGGGDYTVSQIYNRLRMELNRSSGIYVSDFAKLSEYLSHLMSALGKK